MELCNLLVEVELVRFAHFLLLSLKFKSETLDNLVFLLNGEFKSVVGRSQLHHFLPDIQEILNCFDLVALHDFFSDAFLLLLNVLPKLLWLTVFTLLHLIHISHAVKES